MKLKVLRHIGMGLLGASVVGCAFNPFWREPPPATTITTLPTVTTPKALTEQASLALGLAEQCVVDGRKNHTLWTVAVEKLAQARNAAKIFNSDTTITLSQEIIALCARSAAQAKSPPVTW